MSRGLYVYAVTGSGAELPARGIRDRPLRCVQEAQLGAVVSEMGLGALPFDEEDMSEHEEVVEALMDSGPVAPLRFGTVLEDEAAVAMFLRERGEALRAAVERVRGAVELAVQATIADDHGPRIAPALKTGREYMWKRLNASHRRDELARRVHEPLAELARESALRVPSPGAPQIRAAYLVDREAVDAFFERVTELEREGVAAALVCTGPGPPYTFSE
jgi:hypothetical protein